MKTTLVGLPRKRKKGAGRPRSDTPEVRAKIEEAAAIDASVEEIAFYASISRETFYEIMKRDKLFSDRITALREKPVMLARKTAVAKMTESYSNAMDYLKRKRKKEFGDSLDVDSNITISHVISRIRAIKGRGNNGVSGQGETLVELPDSQ